MTGIKDAIAGLLKGGLTGIGDSVKGIIQQVGDNKLNVSEASLAVDKEINRASEAATELLLKDKTIQAELEKAYLLDTQNARDANVKVQGDNPSWLAKNTAFIFDFIFIVAFVTMLFMVFTHKVPEENKEIFYTGFGLLGSYVGQIIGFHRGTSKGSEDKQKTMDNILKKH